MHMFFVGAAKRGHSLTIEERQRFIDTVRSEVIFAAHVQRVVHVAPTPDSIIVGISNLMESGWHETWRRYTFVCGYCADVERLVQLDASDSLAEHASQVAGRFSVLVVDKLRRRIALATQPARTDSVFTAENDRFVFFGNQASVLSALRDGSVRYAPDRLKTFLSSGFFGDDETPYSGVRCLSAYTTVQVADGRVSRKRLCLSTLRNRSGTSQAERPSRPAAAGADSTATVIPAGMPSDLIRAFGTLGSVPCDLGLTGGMDSRLIVAGAAAAGLRIDCFTRSHGDANRADIWVAQALARLARMPHRIVEAAPHTPDSSSTLQRLRETALWTLVATDGMLALQYAVTPLFLPYPVYSLSGAGGEILRGGYAEHINRATRSDVTAFMENMWNHTRSLFLPHIVKEQDDRIQAFIDGFPASVSPGDMLDYLYVDVRCGRWAAASTGASTRRIRPLLDNVMVRHALSIPKRSRQRHLVHRQLIERLLPEAKGLPLSNKFWHGTSPEEREALRAKWPQAFTEPKRSATRMASASALSMETVAAMKEYVVDSGRLTLFADVLRIDEVRRYLNTAPPNYRHYDRFLQSLFSAAALLSEPWRDRRYWDAKLYLSADAYAVLGKTR